MNILLGNNTLSILAGSETWTLTMAKEFKRQGHEVTAYSPDLGLIATKLEAEGIKCYKEIDGESGIRPFSAILEEGLKTPDVIICNHYDICIYLRKKYPNTPIIATIHGILHKKPDTNEIWPEHPAVDANINQYIAVSEEVKDLLSKAYGIDSKIIRNSFDLNRFNKSGKIKTKPEIFLLNSNYSNVKDPVSAVMKEVANHYGAQLQGVGENFVKTYEVEKIIKDVDVVVGMGRSLLEGVCMGKLGICHGRWGTGGVLTPESVKTIRINNFSGRESNGQILAAQDIICQIDKYYNQKNIDEMYKYIKAEHNIEKAAKKYLDIAKKLCAL